MGKKWRELLPESELEELQFESATITPRQTKHYPCIHWSETRKCQGPLSIQQREKKLRTEKAKEGKAYKGEKPCTGIKPDCNGFEYPLPYVPPLDEQFIVDETICETIAFALENNDNLLIVGPPGCGKSSHLMQMAAILNWETNRFSCSEETSSSKIIGQWVVQGDDMVWIDGHVTDALRYGKILLEEEADFMRPELRGELHTVMEKRGALTLHGRHPKTGQTFRETIEPHPDFRWMSTANTIGLGDDAFLYHGTTFMNAAARDRYEAILKMDYPTPDIESEILALKVQSPTGENLSSETIERMIKIANGVRENFKSRSCNFAFTIRRTISWGNYWLRKGPAEGSKLALLNFASLNDRITLRGLIESELAIRIEED